MRTDTGTGSVEKVGGFYLMEFLELHKLSELWDSKVLKLPTEYRSSTDDDQGHFYLLILKNISLQFKKN